MPSASTAAEALDRPGYVGYPVPPGGHRTGGRYRRGRWSGVAIAAFATGCIPWIGVLAALPLGVVALVTIERTGERGKALAVAGMAMSVLIWVASVGILVAVFNDVARRDRTGTITAAGTLYFADIRMGDCLQVNDLETAGAVGLFDITGVPCAQTHNAESVGDVAFAEALYPGHAVLTQRAVQTCTQLAAQYVDPARRGLRPYLFAPTKELWDSDPGARRVMCFLTDQNFSNLSDSVVR